ncbi:MAG: hypothetical protein NC102_08310 [Clostridium sp.]|nr:hypothetical protein [Clostridium sp.]
MNVTISMDGLWAIVDSLSLKNKKWLADKLAVSMSTPQKSTEDEILSGIIRSAKEAKLGKTYPMDTLWEQI